MNRRNVFRLDVNNAPSDCEAACFSLSFSPLQPICALSLYLPPLSVFLAAGKSTSLSQLSVCSHISLPSIYPSLSLPSLAPFISQSAVNPSAHASSFPAVFQTNLDFSSLRCSK
ncbi:hypothetical protein CHARACLAT_001344 [Characodon lateralis]|uniref:Uncharacterized protein n=1 Tax=Characodon lateralis TaxID=208331 RepID=A0ABU7CLN0_9TELE|nr:hypothetical protein [Characodon lateralis]